MRVLRSLRGHVGYKFGGDGGGGGHDGSADAARGDSVPAVQLASREQRDDSSAGFDDASFLSVQPVLHRPHSRARPVGA